MPNSIHHLIHYFHTDESGPANKKERTSSNKKLGQIHDKNTVYS
jgi:hypothetical protein